MWRDEILKKAMHHVDCEVGDAIGMAIDAAVAAEQERIVELAIKMGEDDPHTWAYEFSRDLAKKIREAK